MSFQIKSAEELAKMEAVDLASYLNEKALHDKTELDKLIASKASAEEVQQKQAAMEKDFLQRVDKLQEAMIEQGKHLANLGKAPENKEPETLRGILKKNLDTLKQIKDGSLNGMRTFDVSGTKDMTLAASINSQQIPQAQRIEGFNELPVRPLSFLSTIPQANTVKNRIEWVYRATLTGGPAATAEAATKSTSESTFNLGAEDAAKYTALSRVSMEMLDDIDFMEDAIRTDLMRRLLIDVEDDAYAGTGAAGPPQLLRGVRTVATAFAAPAGTAGQVDEANNLDVLNAAITQIILADQPLPTHVFVNPVDLFLLKSTKVGATDRRYVSELYETANGLRLANGIQIIPSRLVTQDEYLIGHMPFARLWNRMAPTLAIGLNGDDFSQNMRTLLTEWRGMVVVKNNDRTAFVQGTFSADKTALETP